MAIRIFFKHLFCSIRKRPAQPLLLMLVLTLAVTVCITSVNLYFLMTENQAAEQQSSKGNAEYLLTTNSLSASRFFVEESVSAVLPDDVETCGIFGLQTFWGENHVFAHACATDFQKIQTFFGVTFESVSPINEEDLFRAVFISKTFAKENTLQVGQTVEIEILGIKREFVVYGILTSDFLATYPVLVDHCAVLDVLKSDYPVLSVLDDALTPTSSVYIIPNGKNAEVEAALSTYFSDLSCINQFRSESFAIGKLKSILILLMAICCLFVIIVNYCCFYILSMRREEETNLLKGVGAKAVTLRISSCIELFLYFCVGFALGFALSKAILSFFIDVGNLTYCKPVLHGEAVLAGFSFPLLSSQFSLFVYIFVERNKRRVGKRKNKVSVQSKKKFNIRLLFGILFGIGLAFLVGSVFAKTSLKAVFGLLSLPFFAFSIFLLGRIILSFFAKRKKRNPKRLVAYYAFKNANRVETLQNTAGLLAVSFFLTFSMSFLSFIGECGINTYETFLRGEYLVTNYSEQPTAVASTENVENVYYLYKDLGLLSDRNDAMLDVFAFSDRQAYSEKFPMDVLPQGDEVFMPDILAEKYGFRLGDEIHIVLGNKIFTFRYTQTIKTNMGMVMINAEDNGFPYTMMLVDAVDGVKQEVVQNEILEYFPYQGVTFLSTDQVIGDEVEGIRSILLCVELTTVFCTSFAFIGIADSIVSGYLSRRWEFLCYRYGGMTKKNVRRMIRKELFIAIMIGVILFFLFLALLLLIIYEICLSLDLNIIWNLIGVKF